MKQKSDFPFNVSDIISRSKFILGLKRDSDLAEHLGVSGSTLSNWISRNSLDISQLLRKLPEIDYNWLLTGKTRSDDYYEYYMNGGGVGEFSAMSNGKVFDRQEDRSVPLYDITAVSNLNSLLNDGPHRLLGKMRIPQAPRCDGAVFVSGDAMYPLLKAGDIVGFKALAGVQEIIYGEMYLVSFVIGTEEFLVVKYINRSDKKDCIRLISYNAFYQPMDIPSDSVRSLGIIKFSVRKNMIL